MKVYVLIDIWNYNGDRGHNVRVFSNHKDAAIEMWKNIIENTKPCFDDLTFEEKRDGDYYAIWEKDNYDSNHNIIRIIAQDIE